jgi:hypothetical protein
MSLDALNLVEVCGHRSSPGARTLSFAVHDDVALATIFVPGGDTVVFGYELIRDPHSGWQVGSWVRSRRDVVSAGGCVADIPDDGIVDVQVGRRVFRVSVSVEGYWTFICPADDSEADASVRVINS